LYSSYSHIGNPFCYEFEIIVAHIDPFVNKNWQRK
jgi:hypothetical protein